MKSKWLSHGLLCFSLVFAAGIAAHADTVTLYGSIWALNLHISDPIAPYPSRVEFLPLPAGPPDATFTVTTSTTLNLFGYFPGAFIASGGGVVLTGNDPAYLDDPFSDSEIYGSYISLTGTVNVRHGETFTFGHHDGAVMVVTKGPFEYGLDGGSSGPTSFHLGTYTYDGPTLDDVDLQITLGACCNTGGPWRIETNFPTGGNTPEPSTLLLMAGGLAFLGFSRRYRLLRSK